MEHISSSGILFRRTFTIDCAAFYRAAFRANLRVIIEKSFFKYKYDYREEWLRFIKTISGDRESKTDADSRDFRGRVIQAVCNLLESPEGALWLRRNGDDFFSCRNMERITLGIGRT